MKDAITNSLNEQIEILKRDKTKYMTENEELNRKIARIENEKNELNADAIKINEDYKEMKDE